MRLGGLERDPRFAALQRLFPGQVVNFQPAMTNQETQEDLTEEPDVSEVKDPDEAEV